MDAHITDVKFPVVFFSKLNLNDLKKAATVAFLRYNRVSIQIIICLFFYGSIIGFLYQAFPSIPVIVVLFCAGYYFVHRNKILKSIKLSSNFEEMRWEVDMLQIRRSCKSFSEIVSFNEVKKLTETKDWLFIWDSDSSYLLVPKKALSLGLVESLKSIILNSKTDIAYVDWRTPFFKKLF